VKAWSQVRTWYSSQAHGESHPRDSTCNSHVKFVTGLIVWRAVLVICALKAADFYDTSHQWPSVLHVIVVSYIKMNGITRKWCSSYNAQILSLVENSSQSFNVIRHCSARGVSADLQGCTEYRTVRYQIAPQEDTAVIHRKADTAVIRLTFGWVPITSLSVFPESLHVEDRILIPWNKSRSVL
jgi:hypothetical protein